MSEIPQISNEFIKENQNLVRPMQKSSAPYSKKDRFKRRQEVCRLHFDLGYSAVKIADLMKVNRNTINNDIKYWYAKLAKDWDEYDIQASTMKQLERLEMQRSRLRQELDNHTGLEAKLSIEKLILEIDDKIGRIILNTIKTTEFIRDTSVSTVNKWMEENKFEGRLISKWEVQKISATAREKIDRIIKEDKSRKF